ncbi:MAG: hypothetical protein A2X83_04180 [Desulfuromonadales bacterium GWD2_54_10]|nr:MAG: hypothetical protein A2X83_04180 [Desulfuromonadales bacterium GWD2_54_10]
MISTNRAQSNSNKFSPVKSEGIDLEAAQALFQEALILILNDEKAALRVLRELINATIGFERISVKMHKPAQSIQRMVSDKGNPTFHNLMAILAVIRKSLNVQVEVTVVPAWKLREIEVEVLASIQVRTGLVA